MTAVLQETQAALTPKQSYWFHVTASMFDQMIDAGVIDRESRVELLDGHLVEIEAMKPAHVNRTIALTQRLVMQFSDKAQVSCQNSIELPQDGRPQPDFALLRRDRPEDQYAHPEDVYLLIEVSDSSLQKDREWKAMIYARDGISEYWILNMQANQLEVHRDPEDARYSTTFVLKAGQMATCLAFPQDPIDWFSGFETVGS